MKDLAFTTTLVEDSRSLSQKESRQKMKLSLLALMPATNLFKLNGEFNSWNDEAHCVIEEILLFVTWFYFYCKQITLECTDLTLDPAFYCI